MTYIKIKIIKMEKAKNDIVWTKLDIEKDFMSINPNDILWTKLDIEKDFMSIDPNWKTPSTDEQKSNEVK